MPETHPTLAGSSIPPDPRRIGQHVDVKLDAVVDLGVNQIIISPHQKLGWQCCLFSQASPQTTVSAGRTPSEAIALAFTRFVRTHSHRVEEGTGDD